MNTPGIHCRLPSRATNIGKALGAIALNANGVKTAANVARALSNMASGSVRSIESSLNFLIIPRTVVRGDVDDLKNMRRAAILLSKTVPTAVPRQQYLPTTWDDMELDSYVGAYRRVLNGRPIGVGMYLGPSFWAYSDHADREHTKAAWPEAASLLAAGLRALSKHQEPRADNLYRRWFGTGSRAAVQSVLDRVKIGLASTLVGLAYAGDKVAGNLCEIKEEGFGAAGQAGPADIGDGWGVAKYQIPVIGLERRFFLSGDTTGPRTELHTLSQGDGMQVSRGGAVLHECTHVFADTNDVDCNSAVYQKAGLPVPNGVRSKGYGPSPAPQWQPRIRTLPY